MTGEKTKNYLWVVNIPVWTDFVVPSMIPIQAALSLLKG
ncbi:hypothetical protein Nizo2766_1305 [Lactiplantibacillus plantarum]|nr:hypothetical protein Nizo1838_1959 [Lactiplantibacillus plantarum]KZT91342.1 hypothetical protein Nizo2256_0707 [Lactiplantibacillus plantarum]KZU41929.1 hypothetical protein Nizo2757_2154 [Lactiplantibacillus plantarum]KZU46242.1 hypothetical protein Nizo2766_1305 [Lactiplantibacillus plantarum]